MKINDYLKNLYENCRVKPPEGDSVLKEIRDGEYVEYKKIAENYQPESILEIGVLLGFSAISFFDGSKKVSRYLGIDIQQYLRNSNILAGEHIDKYKKDTKRSFKTTLTNQPVSFFTEYYDLVHVDGDHSYEGCMYDLISTWEATNKVMIVHDFLSHPPVKQATIDFLPKVKGEIKYIDTVKTPHGFLVIEKKGAK